MSDRVKSVTTYVIELERATPYLGPLADGEYINRKGYIVRKGNGTIYPSTDRSVLVRIETNNGIVGWGETYGICAPKAVCEIINDLLAPVIEGAAISAETNFWQLLYDLVRVRGFRGGFYLDALAAIDIAMWDLKGKDANLPTHKLLGAQHHTQIPGYVSGLPAATIEERTSLAQSWRDKGFNAIKFAAVVSHEGIEREMRALRDGLGAETKLMVDMHWKFNPRDAIKLIQSIEPYGLAFAEAPVKPEDIDGLAEVARNVKTPVAAGEEWHSLYNAQLRLNKNAISIIQPEMAHTGITQFMQIAHAAQDVGVSIAPHATIGIGIFMAASLHASATLKGLSTHEYQHSVFDRNAQFLDGELRCQNGSFNVPQTAGLGVAPSAALLRQAIRVD